MNASSGVPGYAMNQEQHVWKLWRWPCHKYNVNYMIMLINMTMMNVSWWTRWWKVAWQYISEWLWKCHNRYVWWLFWGRYMVGVWYRRKVCGTREASNGGRVRVRIIHGINISHKELTYLLQKSIDYRNEVLRACSSGDRLVGKDHRSSSTATHKKDNQ